MCFLFPLSAFAEGGKIASIKENQKAPFTGFLFDAPAFAKIEADKHTLIEKYELEKKLLADKCEAEKKFLNESWTVTVINDTDFAIRSAFENWMNKINRVSDNTGETDPTAYTADAFVYQLDRDGSTLRAYHFYDIFPTSIGAITLDYNTPNIQEFPVEFQILWWEAVKGTSPAAGGQDIN